VADLKDLKENTERTDDHLHFIQLLRNPYDTLLMRLHGGLSEAGYADSSPSWGTNVFYYLKDGGLRLVELAERTRTTKQAMGYTVDRLEEAGYLERVADPNDGRAKIIRITQRGWEMRRVAGKIIAEVEEECSRRLGEERMRQFEELTKEVSSVIAEAKERD
jgi:DNA-binding MarR family transcriptional regulator